MFLGANTLECESSREREGQGAKWPGNESSTERKFQGVNWPGSYWPICSREQIGPGVKRLGTMLNYAGKYCDARVARCIDAGAVPMWVLCNEATLSHLIKR